MKYLHIVEINSKHVKNNYKNVRKHYMKEKIRLKKGLLGKIKSPSILLIQLLFYLVMKCTLK